MDKKDKENRPNYTYSDLEYVSMYGDLIIWNQIIEKAKEDNIESVILVSDEIKEDWKYKLDSVSCKKISVRAELKEEIYNKAKIKNFTMKTTPEFMEFINNMATNKVKNESIVEVQKSFAIKLDEIRKIEGQDILDLESDYNKTINTEHIIAYNNERQLQRQRDFMERERDLIERGRDLIERGRDLIERGRDLIERGRKFIESGEIERGRDLIERGRYLIEKGRGREFRGKIEIEREREREREREFRERGFIIEE